MLFPTFSTANRSARGPKLFLLCDLGRRRFAGWFGWRLRRDGFGGALDLCLGSRGGAVYLVAGLRFLVLALILLGLRRLLDAGHLAQDLLPLFRSLASAV